MIDCGILVDRVMACFVEAISPSGLLTSSNLFFLQ